MDNIRKNMDGTRDGGKGRYAGSFLENKIFKYICFGLILFTECLHLRIKILSRCFAIIQKVMFAIRGKLQ